MFMHTMIQKTMKTILTKTLIQRQSLKHMAGNILMALNITSFTIMIIH